jgi:hypothetical protein
MSSSNQGQGQGQGQGSRKRKEDALKQEMRYNAQLKLLDLSGLAERYKGCDFLDNSFTIMLWRVIESDFPDVSMIDFSNNRIRNLSQFKKLNLFAPNVIKLAFHFNQIESIDEFENLKGFRDTLDTLIVNDNPLMLKTPNFKLLMSSAVAMFPSLTTLNASPAKALIYFGLPPSLAAAAKLPDKQASYCPDHLMSSLETFMLQYLKMFDDDRIKVFSAYGEHSQFSLSVAEDVGNWDMQPYAQYSHNINKLNRRDVVQSKRMLFKGLTDISRMMLNFPKTHHDLSNIAVDCIPIQIQSVDMLSISVCGQFAELDTNSVRKFHRSFLLQSQAGLQIVSDQLFIVTKASKSSAPVGALVNANSNVNNYSVSTDAFFPAGQINSQQMQQQQQQQQMQQLQQQQQQQQQFQMQQQQQQARQQPMLPQQPISQPHQLPQLNESDKAMVSTLMSIPGVDFNKAYQALVATHGNLEMAKTLVMKHESI